MHTDNQLTLGNTYRVNDKVFAIVMDVFHSDPERSPLVEIDFFHDDFGYGLTESALSSEWDTIINEEQWEPYDGYVYECAKHKLLAHPSDRPIRTMVCSPDMVDRNAFFTQLLKDDIVLEWMKENHEGIH